MGQQIIDPPEGFVLEDQIPAPPDGFIIEDPSTPQPPKGFFIEDQSGLMGGANASIQNARTSSLWSQIKSKVSDIFRESPEEASAKFENIAAIHAQTKIPLPEVYKRINELSRDPKITGIRPGTLTNEEYTALVFTPLVAQAAIAAPLTTGLTIAGFTALDKVINLKNFLPSDASDTSKTAIELADFIAKGAGVGMAMKGAVKGASPFIEKYFQTKVNELKLPEKFQLTSEQIKDIFQTGTKTTAEQQSLLAGLGLSREAMKGALKEGLVVEVPAERIMRMVDKPGWAAFKKAFKIPEAAEVFSKDPLLQQLKTQRSTSQTVVPEGPVSPIGGAPKVPEPPKGFVVEPQAALPAPMTDIGPVAPTINVEGTPPVLTPEQAAALPTTIGPVPEPPAGFVIEKPSEEQIIFKPYDKITTQQAIQYLGVDEKGKPIGDSRFTLYSSSGTIGQESNQTGLEGIEPYTLDVLKNIANKYDLHMTITAGTEKGHKIEGDVSHEKGKKVDLRSRIKNNMTLEETERILKLNNTIESWGATQWRTNELGKEEPGYVDPDSGAIFWKEKDHWDVEVGFDVRPSTPVVPPEPELPKPVQTKTVNGRKKAYFKIRVGQEWKTPVGQPPKAKPGEPMNKVGPGVINKKNNSEIAIQKIQASLDDVKIEYKGDYAIISGYPKGEGYTGPSGYGLGNAPNQGMWKNTIENLPGTQSIQNLQPVEAIELIRLAKDLKPDLELFVKKTGDAAGRFSYRGRDAKMIFVPELFLRGNEMHLAITIAHELGHMIDWLPDETIKRGNIWGRIKVIRKYMQETFGQEALKNQDLKKELLKVTQYLHPYDPATVEKKYKAYRESAVELYAEAISLLLNSPGKMEELAPQFMKLFFENLDRKPAVKLEYWNLQQFMNDVPEKLIQRRQEDITAMFVKGEELRKQIEAERELRKINYWERIRQLIDDINYPIISKVKKFQQRGQFLPKETSPIYELEERSLVDNDQYLMMSAIDANVLTPIHTLGISDHDFSAYLYLMRVKGLAGVPTMAELTSSEEFKAMDEEEQTMLKELTKGFADRQDLANPLGYSPATAERQLAYMREQLGPDKWAAIEDAANKFHEIVFKIVEEAVRVGSYNQQTFFNKILPLKDIYVSFGVLNYLQDYVPAAVKLQKGTIKEIESPMVTTILKMISLNRLNARQRAANALRDWLKTDFPGEIEKAKRKANLEFIEPSPGSGLALIHMLEDGKRVAYVVDQYIAKSMENSKNGDVLLVTHLINKVFKNQLFKNLYITYNPGFAFAFNPIRDFKRTYVNLNALGLKISVFNLLKGYIEALPSAIRRQRGIEDTIVKEMMEIKAIDTPFIDFNFDIQGDTYHGILRKMKLLQGKEHQYVTLMKPLLRPLLAVMEGIRFVGSTLESLSKIAGYNELVKTGRFSRKEIAYNTRTYIGTPNWRRGGSVTSITNSIAVFSNIWKEGLKSDLQLATHPTTRSGFWWAHFKVNIFWKLMMIMGATGLLGKELKDHYDKQSEYDKTNYITVPLGETEDGKAVYLRLPHDESGRLMAGMFWKTAMAAYKGKPEELQQVLAFGAGQLPNLAPGISIANNWWTYLNGKNPYDPFRGQYLISDTAWKAGGWPALKKMVQWTVNQSGQVSFSTYDDKNKSTFEATVQVTPIFNRLIKISDYGETEHLKDIREDIEQKNAQKIIKKSELIDKAIKQVKEGASINTVAREVAKKLYDKPTLEQFHNIIKNIKQENIRGENAYIDMLLTARSNEEKILILQEMRQKFDAQKMRELERLILRNKAASPQVIMKSRRQK